MEELEAVDWYNQRVDACKDSDLKVILAHNRDEEKEHGSMVLEWIRRWEYILAQVELKRTVSLPLLILYGLGTMIGAGIYVLLGKVAGSAGVYMPVAFAIASMVAGFTALAYAELSSRFPESAGEVVYVHNAFSWTWLSAITGWLVIATGTYQLRRLPAAFPVI